VSMSVDIWQKMVPNRRFRYFSVMTRKGFSVPKSM
jgi:hypothetical protein